MTANWKLGRQIIGIGLCAVLNTPAAAQLLPPDMLDNASAVEAEVVYRFSVELIVFEYAGNVAAGNEIFELEPAAPPLQPEIPVFADLPDISAISPDDEIETNSVEDLEIEEIPTLADIEFKLMQADEMTMGGIHERLMKLDAYQPVLWGGWTQITKEQGVLLPIRLRRLGSPPIDMSGTLTLYLKNYLHLVVDLTRELQTTLEPDIYRQQTQTVLYQINEDRIFRSGQLRYYDHPKFGVLARVNRADAEVPEDDAADEAGRSGQTMVSEVKTH